MPLASLQLEYPITRNFPGRTFSYATFAGAGVVLLFLALVNGPQLYSVAVLGGYETVPNFDSNFNVTQSHWFDKLLPRAAKPKPGTLCDPRLFGLGDAVMTNYTMFPYVVSVIDSANAGDAGFAYRGGTLDNCDITSLLADAAQIEQKNNFEITLRADWSESYLLGAQKTLRNFQAGASNRSSDARASVLNTLMGASGHEFADRIFQMLILSNRTTPQLISFEADFPWCPASLGPAAPCGTQSPPLKINGMFEWLGNGSTVQAFSGDLLTNDTEGIVSNMVQAVYAAVRLDLGNPAPSNFLLQPALIPSVILSTFPRRTPQKTGGLTNGTYDIPGLLPLTVPGPAVLDGVYLCRFTRAKSPGSAFVAVLVGTLSMFGAVWGIWLTLATMWVKRRDAGANACQDHVQMMPRPTSPDEKSRFMDV
ncbi:hypothetical protein B0H14DRAFT_3603051 [Mycena olivaceomarginata]|nr:hypothetical protein B0H14DRAFT_3603051 [Mycena olivaceomarginata]